MEKCTIDYLEEKARYILISIPYDKDDELITFDDGVMTELECEEDFTPPMLNAETQMLEMVIDLKEHKVIDWQYKDGYLHLQAKVCDSGTYTLLDADKKPLWQIDGYVPNKLIPPLDGGFGDYIDLPIEADGNVIGWPESSNLSEFIENGQIPEPVKTNKWHRAEDAYYDVMRHKLNQEEMIWLVQRLMAKYSLTTKQVVKEIL